MKINPEVSEVHSWTTSARRRSHELSKKGSGVIAQQEWEGYVVAIEEDKLVARLTDLTAGSEYESEEAIIPFDEISDADKEKMAIGSVFHWVIGYEHSLAGGKRRVSEIIFRDIPRMTEPDLAKGKEWAKEIADALAND